MDLDRIKFEVSGNDLGLAQLAVKALPEGVMGDGEIILKVASLKDKEIILDTPGNRYNIELPAGLGKINIYRYNGSNEGSLKDNGRIDFDYGGFHYVIPSFDRR